MKKRKAPGWDNPPKIDNVVLESGNWFEVIVIVFAFVVMILMWAR